jgi:hypothetical protein
VYLLGCRSIQDYGGSQDYGGGELAIGSGELAVDLDSDFG